MTGNLKDIDLGISKLFRPECGLFISEKVETCVEQDHLQYLLDKQGASESSPFSYSDEVMNEIMPGNIFIEKNNETERECIAFVDKVLAEFEIDDQRLSADIKKNIGLMWSSFNFDNMNCRFEVLSGNSCKKFHVDSVQMRLVSTYCGPGTEFYFLNNSAEVTSMEEGQSGFFKGKLFENFKPTVLHRSPPIAGTGIKRLVFIADF